MKFLALTLLAIVAVISGAVARKCFPTNCGKHASFNRCGSMCGDLSCEHQSWGRYLCARGCNSGCFCDQGFVRGPNGDCIKVEDCPVCSDNEHYEMCGTACERTCETRFIEIMCTKQCVSKCFCDEGYVRNGENCVLSEDCPEATTN